MNLDVSPEDEAFRLEVRRYFAEEYPRAIIEKVASGRTMTKADHLASENALNAKGWLAPGWPKEYGGTGWTITQRFIFEEEMQSAGALRVIPMGLIYVAPLIYTFGTEEQKKQWLPDILTGRAFWAQGYSEPEAGSDLANLSTSAVRDGDEYVVNGVKVWTSQAQYADWIFLLVRTSRGAKKQEGITFLCVDMKTPGITVTPIPTIDGVHHLNRVTFDNVRAPVANRIGEEGKGWTYSRQLLAFERTSYARLGSKRRDLEALHDRISGAFDDDWAARRRLAELEVDYLGLHYTTLRALAPLASGQAPGDEASALKILSTELSQAITELNLELAGQSAAPFAADRSPPNWTDAIGGTDPFGPLSAYAYLGTRAETIYGGANEVQKNIIARQLGL